MLNLRDAIVGLYRKAATSLPSDVEAALKHACKKEKKDRVPMPRFLRSSKT